VEQLLTAQKLIDVPKKKQLEVMTHGALKNMCKLLDESIGSIGGLSSCVVNYPEPPAKIERREEGADGWEAGCCKHCCTCTLCRTSCQACTTTKGGCKRRLRWLVMRPFYLPRYVCKLAWWIAKVVFLCRHKQSRNAMFARCSKCGMCEKWDKPDKRTTSEWWTFKGQIKGDHKDPCDEELGLAGWGTVGKVEVQVRIDLSVCNVSAVSNPDSVSVA
jgi:hypothetical protein